MQGDAAGKMKAIESAQAVWLFGLPCAGKTTLAAALAGQLRAEGHLVKMLDGDVLRKGLCSDLGYGTVARGENLRRAAEVSRLFMEEGILVVAAFITLLREHRTLVRDILAPYGCLFAHLRCPVEECERRDVKGQYLRARRGEIQGFTGLDGSFEEPLPGECASVDTGGQPVEACVLQLRNMLEFYR